MWPLIERELRIALRRNAPRQRWYFALAGGGITLVFLLLSMAVGASLAASILFHFLLWIGLYVAVVPVIQTAADCFSMERRNGTLSLLFLAGLKPLEIFISKLSGIFTHSLFNLLALTPFLAILFLSGGISLECFIAINVLLLNLLLFALSMSVLGSVLCRDDGAALALALSIGGGLCVLTPGIWYVINSLSTTTVSGAVLCFSPGYAARLVHLRLPVGTAADFWRTTAITFSYSATALTISALVLRFTWQDNSGGFFSVLFRRWFCDFKSCEKLRLAWLERNAFGWLIIRDRVVVRIVGIVLIGIGLLWMAGALAWPKRFATPANALVTAAVLNTSVMGAVAFAAARRFGHDRNDGALELLLTTPLNVAEIMGGYHAALREQFRPTVCVLAAGNAIIALIPLMTHAWTTRAVITYILAWSVIVLLTLYPVFTFASLAMWVSLNTGRPVHSAMRAFNFGWIWLWIGFHVFNSRIPFRQFPGGGIGELVVVAFIAVVTWILVAGGAMNTSHSDWLLAMHFREISAAPVPPPSDPRWKKWDTKVPFSGYALHDPSAAYTRQSILHRPIVGSRADRT